MLKRIQNILVPVAFDSFSREELITADNLASQYGADVHILHAYQDVFKVLSMRTLDLDKTQIEETVQKEVSERMRLLRQDAALSSNTIEVIRKGDTAEQILNYIKEAKIDLLVMATHGRVGIESFFLGSVTQKIVRYASCPVLTLRIQEPRTED